jgi:hypothetical protein
MLHVLPKRQKLLTLQVEPILTMSRHDSVLPPIIFPNIEKVDPNLSIARTDIALPRQTESRMLRLEPKRAIP